MANNTFLLFDTTHNFKNIFNNWINKKIFLLPARTDVDDEVPKLTDNFHHVEKLYATEEAMPLKVAHKL